MHECHPKGTTMSLKNGPIMPRLCEVHRAQSSGRRAACTRDGTGRFALVPVGKYLLLEKMVQHVTIFHLHRSGPRGSNSDRTKGGVMHLALGSDMQSLTEDQPPPETLHSIPLASSSFPLARYRPLSRKTATIGDLRCDVWHCGADG